MSDYDIPRPEYPRPQMVRKDWLNLNGRWEFEMDLSDSGQERKLFTAHHLNGRITIPFCPESRLSGVGFRDFMPCVWYRREIEIPDGWMSDVAGFGAKVFLHIGAADYESIVYINGQEAGRHRGGFTPFFVDVTPYIDGKTLFSVTICVRDQVRSHRQPAGKQSARLESYGCYYTRTTGIWQTVWLEKVPKMYIRSLSFDPDVENASVKIHVETVGSGELVAEVFYEGKFMGRGAIFSDGGPKDIIVALEESHLWEPGIGRLYDVFLSYGEDRVQSYFGLRSVRLDGMRFLINGKSVFQRLVLDQGFYPDGIYTAPDEEDLIRDIRISMEAGFNGARLHEKVFEPRFLYHCDQLGYLVWGEYPNWGFDVTDAGALAIYLPEWMEAVERDRSHPSVIGWCPFNETWDFEGRRQEDEVLRQIYRVTRALDPARPCIDTSGNFHVETDIFDLHDYDQNPETFEARYRFFAENHVPDDRHKSRQKYGGQPVFISEYGGIKWDADGGLAGWGYGEAPKTEEEFLERYRKLTQAILGNERIFGFCYTQLYDVEQEKNGLYTYERKPKFDMERIRAINTAKADIE